MTNATADPAPTRPLLLGGDDDRLVLATLVAGLRQAGFDVVEADNGDEAILLARRHRPPLALLDIRMEGKSGLDVARYLAAHTETGFLFLSAFSDRDAIDEAMSLGALGYLVKPLDIRQIVPAVEAALLRRSKGPASRSDAAAAPPQTAPADGPPAGGAQKSTEPDPDPNRASSFPAVPVALGLLIERHRLNRVSAWSLLQSQARASGRSPDRYAADLLQMIEQYNERDGQ